jgi:hypothetical protein
MLITSSSLLQLDRSWFSRLSLEVRIDMSKADDMVVKRRKRRADMASAMLGLRRERWWMERVVVKRRRELCEFYKGNEMMHDRE